MNILDLCEANKALGIEVRDFILDVPDAKEESITDYLVWKWRSLDKKFNYINVKTFNRDEENAKTGADFELELWLVGSKQCVPLIFQAKKFTRPFAGYVSKLNYPKNSKAQLLTLLQYAANKRMLPFYSIYTHVQADRPLCGGRDDLDTGIYMIDAQEIEKFADGVHGRQVSLAAILKRSNPFHCMFCCPMSINGGYFQKYFRSQVDSSVTRMHEEMPSYALQLLNTRNQQGENVSLSREALSEDFPPVRAVGIYDLRDRE